MLHLHLHFRLLLLPAATALFATAALVAPTQARAETYHTCKGYIDSVPATINQQGVWCLRQDLSTSITNGVAIVISTNNVTIDCNGFKIGGLGGGAGATTIGIFANERFNATVRNCNVRGFLRGTRLLGGGGHVVERNSYNGNTFIAIEASGPGSMIRSNQVIDTGGSTASTIQAYGIYAANGVDVIDNTVNGVAAIGADAHALGIYAIDNGDASIIANRIRGLAANGTGSAFGIYSGNSGREMVRDNDLQGTGVAGSIGIRCVSNQATARDNVISGFATGISGCLLSGNTVNGN